MDGLTMPVSENESTGGLVRVLWWRTAQVAWIHAIVDSTGESEGGIHEA